MPGDRETLAEALELEREREACAAIADGCLDDMGRRHPINETIAAAIRARKGGVP